MLRSMKDSLRSATREKMQAVTVGPPGLTLAALLAPLNAYQERTASGPPTPLSMAHAETTTGDGQATRRTTATIASHPLSA